MEVSLYSVHPGSFFRGIHDLIYKLYKSVGICTVHTHTQGFNMRLYQYPGTRVFNTN